MNKYKLLLFCFLFSFQLMAQNNSYKDSIKSLLESKSNLERVDLLISVINENKVNEDLFINYANKALTLCDEYKLTEKKALIYSKVIEYLHWKGNKELQYKYIIPALKIAEKITNPLVINDIYKLSGMAYNRDGNFSKAIYLLFKALRVVEKTSETYATLQTLMLIMISYDDQGKSELVFEYGKKFFEIADKADKKDFSSLLPTVYSTLGRAFFKQGDYQQSLDYAEKGIELVTSDKAIVANKSIALGLSYVSAAAALVKLKNYKKANLYYRSAESIFKTKGGTYGMNVIYNGLAEMFFGQGEMDSTIFYAEKALDPKSRGAFAHKGKSLLLMANAFSKLGNYKKAFFYHQLYSDVKDTLLNIESENKINELQTIYQTKKKEQQNKLLRLETEKQKTELFSMILGIVSIFLIFLFAAYSWYKTKKAKTIIEKQNSILKFQKHEIETQKEKIMSQKEVLQTTNQQLLESNKNKDKFFSIISHDLKSPFNSILGITEMLVSNYDELTSEDVKEMIHVLRNSSVKVFALLEGLLDWARTQTDRMKYEFKSIDLFDTSIKIIDLLQTSALNKNILLKNGVKENTLVFADEKATETVLRNLIANAIKFTQPDGIIKVESKRKQTEIAISVSDNGIGMSEEDTNKLFKIEVHHTTIGTNNETGTGVGLILCKELVEKQGGKIWVESELGKGSKFIFTLPKSYK